MTDAGPVLEVMVDASDEIHAALTAADAVDEAGSAIAAATDGLLHELGVPGRSRVTVRVSDQPLRAGLPLRLTVDGRRCRYPGVAARRALEHHLGAAAAEEGWLSSIAGDGTLLVAFLRDVCAEALSARPGVLVGLPQVEAYRAGWPAAEVSDRWPPQALLDLLRDVLDLRLSLGDQLAVTRVLARTDGRRGVEDARTVRESLIAALRPDVLEMHVTSAYLRELTDTNDTAGVDDGIFAYLRKELFRELGLLLPTLRIVTDDDLPARAIQFRVNALTTAAHTGLAAGTTLVNEPADRLSDMDALPITNPANGRPAAVVEARFADQMAERGLTTWSPLAVLLLTTAAVVRTYAQCLVDTRVADRLVEQLQPYFPDLVRVATRYLPPARLAALVRNLLAEGVSVHNLRYILDVAVEHYSGVGTPPDDQELDDAALLAAVRAGLRRQITHQQARGGTTLVSYLVGPDIERLLGRQPGATESELDEVADAVAAELESLPATTAVPALLTVAEARSALARLTALEFPTVPVLSFDELADTVVVQPIARIALP